VNGNGRPVLVQNPLAERFPLNELHGRETTKPLRGKRKPADATEGVKQPQHGPTCCTGAVLSGGLYPQVQAAKGSVATGRRLQSCSANGFIKLLQQEPAALGATNSDQPGVDQEVGVAAAWIPHPCHQALGLETTDRG